MGHSLVNIPTKHADKHTDGNKDVHSYGLNYGQTDGHTDMDSHRDWHWTYVIHTDIRIDIWKNICKEILTYRQSWLYGWTLDRGQMDGGMYRRVVPVSSFLGSDVRFDVPLSHEDGRLAVLIHVHTLHIIVRLECNQLVKYFYHQI